MNSLSEVQLMNLSKNSMDKRVPIPFAEHSFWMISKLRSLYLISFIVRVSFNHLFIVLYRNSTTFHLRFVSLQSKYLLLLILPSELIVPIQHVFMDGRSSWSGYYVLVVPLPFLNFILEWLTLALYCNIPKLLILFTHNFLS